MASGGCTGRSSIPRSIRTRSRPLVSLMELAASPPKNAPSYWIASHDSLQSKISCRLALGWAGCASTASRSSSGKWRMTSETLRYWPDLASWNARSIAPVIIASYLKQSAEAKRPLSTHCGHRRELVSEVCVALLDTRRHAKSEIEFTSFLPVGPGIFDIGRG